MRQDQLGVKHITFSWVDKLCVWIISLTKKLFIFLPKFKHSGRGWGYRNFISVQQSDRKTKQSLLGAHMTSFPVHPCRLFPSSQLCRAAEPPGGSRSSRGFQCQLFSWATGPALSLSLCGSKQNKLETLVQSILAKTIPSNWYKEQGWFILRLATL